MNEDAAWEALWARFCESTALYAGASGLRASVVGVQWLGLRCRVIIDPTDRGLQVDIRTKPNMAESNIVASVKSVGDDGRVGVVVEDEELEGSCSRRPARYLRSTATA
jgi:2-methylisocitrate lyase-like PEP mutase family enzyme